MGSTPRPPMAPSGCCSTSSVAPRRGDARRMTRPRPVAAHARSDSTIACPGARGSAPTPALQSGRRVLGGASNLDYRILRLVREPHKRADKLPVDPLPLHGLRVDRERHPRVVMPELAHHPAQVPAG